MNVQTVLLIELLLAITIIYCYAMYAWIHTSDWYLNRKWSLAHKHHTFYQ